MRQRWFNTLLCVEIWKDTGYVPFRFEMSYRKTLDRTIYHYYLESKNNKWK